MSGPSKTPFQIYAEPISANQICVRVSHLPIVRLSHAEILVDISYQTWAVLLLVTVAEPRQPPKICLLRFVKMTLFTLFSNQ